MNYYRDEQTETALTQMLQSLPPSVAQRVHEKYEADRSEFLKFVEEQKQPQDPKHWAKRSCTKCNGRGILGTLVKPSGEEVVPACSCTSKNYAKWLVKLRQEYNALKEQGHEKKTD